MAWSKGLISGPLYFNSAWSGIRPGSLTVNPLHTVLRVIRNCFWINNVIDLYESLCDNILWFCRHNYFRKISIFFLISAVAEVKLRDDQYTLEHMHAFGMYNYLHCDSWYQDSVYYIDNLGRIMNLAVMLVRKKYIVLGFFQ